MARHGLELHLIWTSAQQRVKRCFFELSWNEKGNGTEGIAPFPFNLVHVADFCGIPPFFSDGLLGRSFWAAFKSFKSYQIGVMLTNVKQNLLKLWWCNKTKGAVELMCNFWLYTRNKMSPNTTLRATTPKDFSACLTGMWDALNLLISVMGEFNDGN